MLHKKPKTNDLQSRTYRQLLAVLTLGLCVLALSALSHAASKEEIEFDIRDTLLSEALLNVARQANVAIIFSADSDFETTLSTKYLGPYRLKELLNILLADTALEAEFIRDDVIAIKPRACLASQSCRTASNKILAAEFNDLASNPHLEQMMVLGKTLTGSRIRRTEFSGTAPVDIISSFDIELAGAQSVGELFRNLPSVVGNSTSTAISNGGDGTASVTLRGLPASNTLVLLNGRRVANDGLGGETFDLNSLAPSSIDRIEVLKSGSSAVYGSDAIAGVINIILKREYEGLLIDTYYGSSAENDLDTQATSLSFGHLFDRGSVFVSAALYEQGDVFSRNRAVSASADTRPFGGNDKRSSATPNARINLPSGDELTFSGALGDGSVAANYRAINANDLFNYSDFTSAIVPADRKSIYASANIDLNDSLEAFAEFGFTSTESTSTLAPTPIFTAFESIPLTVAADNPFNPFGVAIDDVRKRGLEFGPRQQANKAEAHRAAIGLEGKTRRLQWDASWHWSKTDAAETFSNLIDAEQLQRGLGPATDCQGLQVDGCEPVNLFGPSGSVTPAQQQFLSRNAQFEGYSKLYGLIFNTTFTAAKLPAGMLDVAMGMEYRREATSIRPRDPLLITIGGANMAASAGKRTVREFYFESLLPLLGGEKGKPKLSMELAGRYSRYSDFGGSFNPRIAVKFRPFEDLILRSSYAQGFRAPSLLELFGSAGESQAFLIDPCSDAENIGTLSACPQLTDATRLQFLTLRGGNTKLQPEESEFYSAGMHWSPASLEHFTTSLDYFYINQKNVIDANAQFILDQNASNGVFDDRVIRAPNGEIERIIASKINIGRRKVQGIDFAMKYAVPNVRHGRLHLSLNASRLLNYKEQLIPTLPADNLLGTFADEASEGRGALPKWKSNAGLYWKYKQWQANYTLYYISSLEEQVNGTARRINSWVSHDLQTSYLFLIGDGLRFTFGVKNLTDKAAPTVVSAFNDNIDARTHDLIGRYWYVKLAQKF